eukprot:comp22833_c0_seq1/m.35930 comp22833_c0_seq1/g.35930  ORF comp22833_c0_seq1/g.35930 comp22833_c0_seq1/m.35930 type:complete len:332 (-) comp22833_c0_seq1:503-1498(-)
MGFSETLAYLRGQVGPNGYGSASTANEIALKNASKIKGKVAIITGANSGLGKEATIALCKAGVHVVMACRSAEKAWAVEEEIKKEVPDAQITLMDLDLQSLESVRKFASEFAQKGLPLHMLICNAGIMACPYGVTKDGFELQFGTNYIGHFVLVNELLPILKESQPSRVVIYSSLAHRFAYKDGIRFDDPKGDKHPYNPNGAYGQSKLCNLMHALELNRRFQESGYKITANAVHPGVIPTNLFVHTAPEFAMKLTAPLLRAILKNPQQGAATAIWAATDPSLEGIGGRYLADCNFYHWERLEPSDPELVKKLFDYTLKLTGGCAEWPAPKE